MNSIVLLVIGTVLAVSFISPIIGLVQRGEKPKILWSILSPIIWFNVIWYSVLIIEFIQTNILIAVQYKTAVDVITVTLMFLIRFVFLYTFLRLFQKLLNLNLSKVLQKALKISAIIVLAIWMLGLLEFFIVKSRIITNNLLVYTDILIFFIVIVSCIYLIYQTRQLYKTDHQKAIKFLCLIFLIPMILGFLKWLAGGILEDNSLREQLSIPFLVFVLNSLMIVWLLFYNNNVKDFKVQEKRISLANELIEKYKISKREMEVIELICEGYSNKQIAEELFISIETVKDHNSRIYLKTEVKNRTQLAKLFLKDS